MAVFTLSFMGKSRGAIGVSSHHTASVEADSRDEAELRLYDRFEHIESLRVVDVSYEREAIARQRAADATRKGTSGDA